MFFTRITSRVDLACPYEREARVLGLGMQIFGLPAQRSLFFV